MPREEREKADAPRGGAARGAAHRVILALSFAPHLGAPGRARLAGRARRALAVLCDGAAPRLWLDEEHLVVLDAGRRGMQHTGDDGALVQSFGVGGTDWRTQRACDGETLLRAVRAAGAAALADLTPPFAALFRSRRDAPLEAATDACGVFHVYVVAGAGFAACSSSCLALGALTDGGLDLDALAAYARLGFFLGNRTPLLDVRLLRPGERCALAGGTLSVTTWAPTPARAPRYADFAESVDAGAQAVRAAVGSLAAAHPQLGISLSGGLDSRLVLAALPRQRRAALDVLCLDAPPGADAALVRELARRCGFAPTIVDVADFPLPRAARFADAAARRRDHCANPLSTAVLEWAEGALPDTPRLHGQNGELGRGYYSQKVPPEAAVTRERVAALVERPQFAGRLVAPLLAPAYRAPITAALVEELYQWLVALDLPWLEALDELYLGQRMAGWVGTELSRTSMRRVDLSPFFDPRFIAFARRTAPADKRGSRAMAAVLEALDPELAALPLDGRPSPAALWRAAPPTATPAPVAPPPAARPAVLAEPVGAEAIRAAVCAAAAAAGQSLPRAAALPLFAPGALDHALRPDSPLTVVALGFALNVEGILEFLEQVRATPSTALARRA